MTNYVPHYTKKKQILARKEDYLRLLLIQNASPEKIFAAAKDVRDARIRVLRAQRATIAPKGDAQVQYGRLDARIQVIAAMSVGTILAEYY